MQQPDKISVKKQLFNFIYKKLKIIFISDYFTDNHIHSLVLHPYKTINI